MNWKKYLYDWKLFIKILTIIVSLYAMIQTFVAGANQLNGWNKDSTFLLENVHGLWYSLNPAMFLWTGISYFSIETNIIIIVLLILLIIFHNQENENKYSNYYFRLATVVYASTIFITYFLALLPIQAQNNKIGILDNMTFVSSILLHLIVPLGVIVLFLVTPSSQPVTYKQLAFKKLPYMLIFPFLFFINALIKGSLVGEVVFHDGKWVINYSYPYQFLNFKEGLGEMIGISIGILVVIVSFIFLFCWLNNLLSIRKINQLSAPDNW
ncbi:hypothetical protein [Spiroplasma endosymbiont of Nebria brevicollis]|uniref:hypothetical protein n=1 Tax=Spiroplasma endosymbiont of Nebria brevicollis TaxID=3066284 RepID=UPI00313EA79F